MNGRTENTGDGVTYELLPRAFKRIIGDAQERLKAISCKPFSELTQEELDVLFSFHSIQAYKEFAMRFKVLLTFGLGGFPRLDFFDDNDTGGNGGTDGEKPPPKIDDKAKEHIRRLYALAQAVRARERERQREYRRRRRITKGVFAP